MSNHSIFLQKTCRTCGVAITGSSKKEVSLYKKEIMALFHYDLAIDQEQIHPKFVCDICRRKLDRCAEGLKKDKIITYNCDMLSFAEHSEENCFVCTKRNKKAISFQVKFYSAPTNQETINNQMQIEEIV